VVGVGDLRTKLFRRLGNPLRIRVRLIYRRQDISYREGMTRRFELDIPLANPEERMRFMLLALIIVVLGVLVWGEKISVELFSSVITLIVGFLIGRVRKKR